MTAREPTPAEAQELKELREKLEKAGKILPENHERRDGRTYPGRPQ